MDFYLQSWGQILDDITSLFLSEPDTVLNMIQKLAAIDLLEDQVKAVSLFKVLYQLDDVLVTSAVVERVDLLKDPGAWVARDFVDDFDSKLLVGPNVPTGPDGGIGALA